MLVVFGDVARITSAVVTLPHLFQSEWVWNAKIQAEFPEQNPKNFGVFYAVVPDSSCS